MAEVDINGNFIDHAPWQPVTRIESGTEVCFSLGTLKSLIPESAVAFLSRLHSQSLTASFVLSINGPKNQDSPVEVIASTELTLAEVSVLIAKVRELHPDFTCRASSVSLIKDSQGNTIGVSHQLSN